MGWYLVRRDERRRQRNRESQQQPHLNQDLSIINNHSTESTSDVTLNVDESQL